MLSLQKSALLLLTLSLFTACSSSSKKSNEIDDSNITQFILEIKIIGGGQVTSNPSGINCEDDCNESYEASTNILLSPMADNGFIFNRWLGACEGTSICSVEMNEDQTITAEFISSNAPNFQLSVSVNGFGEVSSIPNGVNCPNECSLELPEQTQVTLIASPNLGYKLDHWSGACSGNGTCIISLTSAKEVEAIFSEITSTPILVENYSASNEAITLTNIPKDASGITWHSGINQYLIIQNNAAIIYRYDEIFQFLGQISIKNIAKDTEGISYVGNNAVLIVAEDNVATKVNIDESVTIIDGSLPNAQRYRILPPSISNSGLEGVATRKTDGDNTLARIYVCQEGSGSMTGPNADKRVVYFDMPSPDPLTLLSYEDSSLSVQEPWNAEQALASSAGDLAGMVYDARTGHLILLSERSSRAIQVNPDTGAIVSQLDISGAPQFEGVTLGPNNELVFVSEPNLVRVYSNP